MPVRDFIRGGGGGGGGDGGGRDGGGMQSPNQGLRGQSMKSNQNARKLAAEMARVPVPQIRSSDPNKGTYSQQYQSVPQLDLSSSCALPQGVLEGDMFDTDVEGIDDTTTTTSTMTITGGMVGDNIAIANPRPQRMEDYDPPLLQQQHGQTHQRFAERMAGEYEQRQQGDHRSHGNYEEDQQGLQMEEEGRREEFDDPEVDHHQHHHLLDWADTMELDRHPRTWQEIEAALRQGPRHQSSHRGDMYEPEHGFYNDDIPIRRIANTTSTAAAAAAAAAAASTEQNAPARPATGPATSHPAIKPISRTRLANSRFSTPNPPLSGLFPGNLAGLRSTPRPASVAGRPLSPPPSTKPEGNGMDFMTRRDQQQQQHRMSMGRVNGGIFDTTNLSAVDGSSESSERRTAYTSERISSSGSGVSSIKRVVEANEEGDYPPNILRSKTFAELDGESFDYIPYPMQPVFAPQRPPLSLHEKLDRLKALTEGQRRTFFSSLTLKEWEDSGDWLIDQFRELLKRTKDARKERRKIAMVFEREIARRYADVEAESRAIKCRMNELKTGGLDVLRGQRMD